MSILSVGACRDSGEVNPSPEVLIGKIILGHESHVFQECGSDESFWLSGSLELAERLYQESGSGAEPYQAAFASIVGVRIEAATDGFAAAYDGIIEMESINYWPIEGFDCSYGWREFDFRAWGTEPFWMLSVAEGKAKLLDPVIGEQTWQVEQSELGWESAEGEITISLIETGCRDAMSGTYFGFTADVHVGDRELAGCAARGAAK